MGPVRADQLQSPNALESTLQLASSLVADSERLVAHLSELLAQATDLLEEQRAILAHIQKQRH